MNGTHGFSFDRSGGGKDKDDTDEQCPDTGPGINKKASLPHVPRTRHKFSEDQFTAIIQSVGDVERVAVQLQDRDTVTPIKSNGTMRIRQ